MVIVSSDTRELAGLCDRVVVFSSGQVVAELRGEEVTEDAIAHAMLTSTRRRKAPRGGPRPAGGRRAADGWPAGPRRLRPGRGAGPGHRRLALYTQAHNARFLSSFNLSTLTVLIAALAFISFGQECVILTGGIDLSVGPLAGLAVVIGSFFENDGKGPAEIVARVPGHARGRAGIGLLNGSMVQFARFTPIVATLVTYIALQGVSLVLRPFQGGYISFSIINAITTASGRSRSRSWSRRSPPW